MNSQESRNNGAEKEDAEAAEKGDLLPNPGLPHLYENPKPLHSDVHAGKALLTPITYGFASSSPSVVLHTQEFRTAAAFYPIAFADDDDAMPLAIFGYREGENLFVDREGAWAPGTYVPSYIRRYPFITGNSGLSDETILYVDESSGLLVESASHPNAEPLFEEGKPTKRTEEIQAFCAAFQQQTPLTMAFVDELKKRDLLEPREIRLDLPGGGRQLIRGLRVIEEGRFNSLSDEIILEWRHNGWLPLVYWHWASFDNFTRLIQRESLRS